MSVWLRAHYCLEDRGLSLIFSAGVHDVSGVVVVGDGGALLACECFVWGVSVEVFVADGLVTLG